MALDILGPLPVTTKGNRVQRSLRQAKSNSHQSANPYRATDQVRCNETAGTQSLKREQLLQSWKVASQQCRSYGWEERFYKVKHGVTSASLARMTCGDKLTDENASGDK
ncbi:hypothetical protein AVEN_95246-1 [Araneus ventricosus]|uniref:Uncharacterized protein n=1 Tax=Araneus ventricosus TaxID=182803 RepID=A0A4Y2DHB8_ARAVE|nr:hypothetical protein AVEN_95246-1 [Araneus ventricosus]